MNEDDGRGMLANSVRRMVAARRTPAIGAGIAGLLALVESVARGVSAAQSPGAGGQAQFVLAFGVLALAGTLPLGLLRSSPAGAALAVSSANVLSFGLFQTLTVAALVSQVIVLYVLGRSGALRVAAVFTAPFLVLALVAAGGADGGREMQILTLLLASLGPLAVWGGSALLAREESRAHSAAQQALAGTVLENVTRGERARISRELHDVVAHHISMIAVQAESARLTVPGLPPDGSKRLSAIGDTARTALNEMRRLVGVLREETLRVEGDPETERAPQPGLAELMTLVDTARDVSGAGVRLIVSGLSGPIDSGVELAAYRIVQEALTNARRHAPGCAIDVELGFGDRDLRVRVRDNGPGVAHMTPAAGHGLLGMRERAAAVGGGFQAGVAVGGGVVVEATLPLKYETDR
ncbi:MAG: sensor histidine kinase [Acidimicrobiales bacterium]